MKFDIFYIIIYQRRRRNQPSWWTGSTKKKAEMAKRKLIADLTEICIVYNGYSVTHQEVTRVSKHVKFAVYILQPRCLDYKLNKNDYNVSFLFGEL